MKRKIYAIITLLFILSAVLFAFAGCVNSNDDNTNGNSGNENDAGADGADKRVPVYQGMTITKSNSTMSVDGGRQRPNSAMLLNSEKDNSGNNGNHYGWYKGDHADRENVIDKENPYPDNADNENIEEEIKSSLNVVGSAEEIYYAAPGDDIYINIHINNPDSFEIMSFTLNGKKYSSYMFEDGSDMETIILKYNVGEAVGIVEYTIDAIKYIDGSEIKDVIIDGNKTVLAGIKTENPVTVNVADVIAATNDISFSVYVKDNSKLVEFSGGVLKAVIYDGFDIIAEKDIADGDNSVKFEGLKTNTLYQYAIVGYYDDLSGNGFGMHVLYKDAFYTDSVVLFDDITVGKESISFAYLWHEEHLRKYISALKLYRGDRLVLTPSADAVEITGLLSANAYTLVAEYENGGKTESISIDFVTFEKEVPDLTITNTGRGQMSLGFSVSVTDTDSVGAITKVELIHGNGVMPLEALTNIEINNLLSGNDYTVKVTYTYDLNDGTGAKALVKELTAKTLAKAMPEITITNTEKTQTSLGFSVAITDTDAVGSITKIELMHGSEATDLGTETDITVNDLLSGNDYTITVTYTYNLNDGNGYQTLVKELAAKTEAKTAPSFAVKNENVTTNNINAEYNVTDVDNVLASYKVELYKGSTLVAESTENEISFASLKYYTDYTLKITYTYDLNDGNGIQTIVSEKAYKTLPYIDITNCNIANTSAVSEGETIFMSVNLDNPLGMSIETVVINGETYNVTGTSTKNKIFVEILYNGQFSGGNTYLKIDKINAKFNDSPFVIEPESEFSDNVFINGKLEVIKIEFVNEAFEPIDWAFPSEKVYVLITLDNPTGYDLDSINTVISNLKKLDNNKWYYETSINSSAWTTQTLDTVQYHNEYITKTITYSDLKTSLFITRSETPVYIYSADDLKNISGGYYYELKNDIDLSGMEWQGNSLYGVFNGNGYSINNMSFVGTIKNSNAYLGLFKSGNGVIENLKIKNATMIADVVANDNNYYDAYCGAFIAAENDYIIISNCSVDENSTFGITNTTNASVYIGGFVGISYYADTVIKNSQSFAFITGNSSFSDEMSLYDGVYTGGFIGLVSNYSSALFMNCSSNCVINGYYVGGYIGFVGDYAYVGDAQVYIYDSISSGILEGEYVAGFIGMINNNSAEYKSDFVVLNCLSNCSITANIIGGGIAGIIRDSNILINNCVAIGSINPKSTKTTIDYLVAEIYNIQNTTMIENCYSSKITDSDNCNFCTVDQLNSKSFYTETLGWSEDVWDFSELDVEDGKTPKLR